MPGRRFSAAIGELIGGWGGGWGVGGGATGAGGTVPGAPPVVEVVGLGTPDTCAVTFDDLPGRARWSQNGLASKGRRKAVRPSRQRARCVRGCGFVATGRFTDDLAFGRDKCATGSGNAARSCEAMSALRTATASAIHRVGRRGRLTTRSLSRSITPLDSFIAHLWVG